MWLICYNHYIEWCIMRFLYATCKYHQITTIRNTWSDIWLALHNTLWQYFRIIFGKLRVHAKQTKPKLDIIAYRQHFIQICSHMAKKTKMYIFPRLMLNLDKKHLSTTHLTRHLQCKSNGKDQALSQTSIVANTWVTYKLLYTRVKFECLIH